MSEKYPNIMYEEMIVDATCMNLATNPQAFDVMLMPNLYGSIIGSTIAGLVGGAGIVPGACIGRGKAIFQQGLPYKGAGIIESQ